MINASGYYACGRISYRLVASAPPESSIGEIQVRTVVCVTLLQILQTTQKSSAHPYHRNELRSRRSLAAEDLVPLHALEHDAALVPSLQLADGGGDGRSRLRLPLR